MRPILVLAIAAFIFGGVKVFIDSDSQTQSNHGVDAEATASTADYDIELTLTFDTGPDEFSLDAKGDAPSLLLQLNGKPILKRTDNLLATDSPLVIKNVEGIVVGENEFFVQASPTGDESTPRSLRIRVLRQEQVIAEETIWPEFGGLVQGTVTVEVSQ